MDQAISFIPFAAVLGLTYFLLVMPQQRKAKKHKMGLAKLEVGDEVILNSGIHGFISAIEEQILWLEISDGVEIKVSLSAVADTVIDLDASEEDAKTHSKKDKVK